MIVQTQAYRKYSKKKWLDRKIENSKRCSKIHPIYLTLGQLPLLCIVIWMFNNGWTFSSFFILGAVVWPLDWFDGRFARIFEKETQLGAFLDPLVDKIRFCVPLALFFWDYFWSPIIVLFCAIEASLVLIRIGKLLFSIPTKKKAKLNAFDVGKWKSWGEMIGILILFIWYMWQLDFFLVLSYIVLLASLGLAICSLLSHISSKFSYKINRFFR